MGLLTTIGEIGLMLGISEAAKLIDDISLSQGEAEIVATKIIDAASKKGTNMLRKAQNAIENVPFLASSPSVKNHLLKSKVQASNNLSRVENEVSDLNEKANTAANEIREMGSRSTLTKIGQYFSTGKSTTQRAKESAKDVINKIKDNPKEQNHKTGRQYVYNKLGEKYEEKV